MKRFFLLSLSVLLLTGASLMPSARVQLGYFKVEQEQQAAPVITWQAQVEEQVKEYVLERRTPFSNGEFREVQKRFAAHGIGKPYRFQDDQLYKALSDEVAYKLYAVSMANPQERTLLAEQSINYTTTTVRRTWGSIKAMFQ